MDKKEFQIEFEFAHMTGDQDRLDRAVLLVDHGHVTPLTVARMGGWDDWAGMLRQTFGTSKADPYGNPL